MAPQFAAIHALLPSGAPRAKAKSHGAAPSEIAFVECAMPSPREFILTLSCPDAKGIVHAVSGLLCQAGCVERGLLPDGAKTVIFR